MGELYKFYMDCCPLEGIKMQIISKLIIGLNIGAKAIRLLEEDIEVNIYDF